MFSNPQFEAAQLINPAKVLFELAHHSLLARGHRNGIRVTLIRIEAETPEGCPFVVEIDQPPEISPAKTMKSKILEFLAGFGRPLKGMAIARRIGVKNNGNFRGTLSELVKAGTLARCEDGYELGHVRSYPMTATEQALAEALPEASGPAMEQAPAESIAS